ncbi:type 1 glutamine amidotransferase domain-containing protein [Nocardia pseudobrasiliensis]|uniref:ThiJ/PfpI family protein n=1 Tax=Nocardia pseudobrasiliensis TaxID=45979 RepID=A0A370IC62_9NOCA|nr:type 1 glutamine amidotransferase domain-containing protein [Nocardia pseudobrasiliensis]RDI68200.1 ThiJ/PfpI family protein [Nocardia pseudobrasiliensis]
MIVFLLPDSEYDPTEAAVPWATLSDAGIEVRFATPTGEPAYADPRLTERGFSLRDMILAHDQGERAI